MSVGGRPEILDTLSAMLGSLGAVAPAYSSVDKHAWCVEVVGTEHGAALWR